MNEEQLKQYFAVYTDAWKLFKKHSDPVEDDMFWDNLRKDVDDVYAKYKTEFAKNILVETVNEIERIYMTGVNTNGKNNKGIPVENGRNAGSS